MSYAPQPNIYYRPEPECTSYASMQASNGFYYDPNPDPYQNITNYGGYNSMFQLNIGGLMPASWSPETAFRASLEGEQETIDSGAADWYRYAPDKDAVNRYITSSGTTRFSMNTRNSNGRIVGMPNLLRTNPPVPLSTNEITFNNSENRQALIDAIGCGPIPPGCS
jgi:hypothetical protein